MSKLPEKPSALIRVALADLTKIEADQRYAVAMHTWHGMDEVEGIDREVCVVCFAGVTMAMTLGVAYGEGSSPGKLHHQDRIGSEDRGRLEALNEFRDGFVEGGLRSMGLDLPEGLASMVDIVEYEQDPALFRDGMVRMAYDLEQAGL